MSDKTSLHIFCLHRSIKSSSENNELLNQLILNTSLINGKYLILGDFNFPNYKLGRSVDTNVQTNNVLLKSLQQHKMPSYFNKFTALYILDLIKNLLSLT